LAALFCTLGAVATIPSSDLSSRLSLFSAKPATQATNLLKPIATFTRRLNCRAGLLFKAWNLEEFTALAAEHDDNLQQAKWIGLTFLA